MSRQKISYRVIDGNGVEHTRSSHRTYTHAVVCHYTWADYVMWAGSAALAAKAAKAAKAGSPYYQGGVVSVEVIPVVKATEAQQGDLR